MTVWCLEGPRSVWVSYGGALLQADLPALQHPPPAMVVLQNSARAWRGRVGQLCLQGKPTNPHLHAGAYMNAYQKWPIGLRCSGDFECNLFVPPSLPN